MFDRNLPPRLRSLDICHPVQVFHNHQPTNLGRALASLADYKVELKTGELRHLVERVVQDREASIKGLEGAAKFGSSLIIDKVSFHSSFTQVDV